MGLECRATLMVGLPEEDVNFGEAPEVPGGWQRVKAGDRWYVGLVLRRTEGRMEMKSKEVRRLLSQMEILFSQAFKKAPRVLLLHERYA